MLEFHGSWEEHLPLVEFAYNNSYHLIIEMAPTRHYMGDHVDQYYVVRSWGETCHGARTDKGIHQKYSNHPK